MRKMGAVALCVMAALVFAGCGISIAITREPVVSCKKGGIFKVEDTIVSRFQGDKAFFFESGMTITADGAPDAFNPQDDDRARDWLANAGAPGNWWVLVTDANGEPVVQGLNDPMPGFYISMTALQDESKAEADPRRYVNADVVPYIVLPYSQHGDAELGDFAVVMNRRNGLYTYAIFADLGPPRYAGSGSIALAISLGINEDARWGGADGGVLYIVFPGSGNGKPRSLAGIEAEGARLFEAWGGMRRVDTCLDRK